MLVAGCTGRPRGVVTPTRVCEDALHMQFAHIPAGAFEMGSPLTEPLRFDNEVPHRVRITRPFDLAVTHVTVAQFAAFAAATGYQTTAERQGWAYGIWNLTTNAWDKHPGASWRKPEFAQADDHPVVNVSWHDATAFCQWLGTAEGKTVRLPTEAEWEYACRAGSHTAYIWGDDPDAGAGWANALDWSAKDRFTLFPPFRWSDGFVYTSPVASFKPNGWGLYDMLGNTLQWCADTFGDYPTSDVADPSFQDGKQRNLRGGAFVYGPKHTRCAFRGRNDPDFCNYYIGFRVLREE
jgi:sulfatase modifying factor 1